MQNIAFTGHAKWLAASGAAISLLLCSSALAADANAVAERIKTIYAQQGAELSFTNVRADGSNVVLEGTRLKLTTDSDQTTELGDITLENVEDASTGGFTIGKVEVPEIDITEPGEKDRAVIRNIAMENLQLPPESASSPLDKMVLYDRMSVGEVNVETQDSGHLTLRGMEVSLNAPQKNEKIEYSWKVADIDAKLGDNAATMSAPLNMDSFKGSISSTGAWLPQSGEATLDTLEINAAELGKLNITGRIGGYDLAFLEAMQKTQEEMLKANTDNNAASLALLNLSQQLSLKNATIRFDNDTLTQKLLEYYAKQQGSDANTLALQLQLMVPLLATQLKNPEFSQQLGAAANQYLADPKSFSISASPDEAVTFAAIAATASADPTKLIQLLKLSVSSNN